MRIAFLQQLLDSLFDLTCFFVTDGGTSAATAAAATTSSVSIHTAAAGDRPTGGTPIAAEAATCAAENRLLPLDRACRPCR